MNVCEWNSSYSVSISEMDKHHERLFEILNELFTLMAAGADDKSIIHVMDELFDYTHYHFEEEERLMEKMGYPGLEEHRRLHKELIVQLKEFYDEVAHGMAIFVATKIANVGLAWLKNHILLSDHKYGEYMKQQGLQF